MVASYSDRTRILAVHSRRKFLTQAGVLAAGTMGAPAVELPEIASGTETTVDLTFSQSGVSLLVKFDVLRPTGFSAYSRNWKP
jgi:hypothetical protein